MGRIFFVFGCVCFFFLLFRPFENVEELCIRVCFSFFFVFHAKSGTTNNHQIEALSEKKSKSLLSIEKNWFKIFYFKF